MSDQATLHRALTVRSTKSNPASKEATRNWLPCIRSPTANSKQRAHQRSQQTMSYRPTLQLTAQADQINISLRVALYGRFVMGNRGEERLTLSGSWQQGHSTAYRTVSHS
jgi:hypothetical protein